MKKLKYLSTLIIAACAIIAAWLVWNYYTQSPWTRDGKIRAEQVGITPQVSGSILQLNVKDNQLVNAGDVLFRIDDTPYRIAVLNAQAQLAKLKRNWQKPKPSKPKPPATLLAAAVCRKTSSPLKIWKPSIPP